MPAVGAASVEVVMVSVAVVKASVEVVMAVVPVVAALDSVVESYWPPPAAVEIVVEIVALVLVLLLLVLLVVHLLLAVVVVVVVPTCCVLVAGNLAAAMGPFRPKLAFLRLPNWFCVEMNRYRHTYIRKRLLRICFVVFFALRKTGCVNLFPVCQLIVGLVKLDCNVQFLQKRLTVFARVKGNTNIFNSS